MYGARRGAGGTSSAVLVVLATVMAGALACAGCEKKASALSDGKTLFVSACSRCHGADGNGGLPLFDGGPSPRNFHDHSFHASHTDEQIKLTIVNGKGVGMPPFGTTFTDPQLDALVAYVRGFDLEKNGK